MTQPNMIVKGDGSTAIATATTWTGSTVVETGQIIAKGSATDLELVTVLVSLAGTAAAGTAINVSLSGSTSSTFATSTTVSADKGSDTVSTATMTGHAHYAQLQYPYYRATYTPNGAATVTGTAVSVFVFSGVQDSLDNSDQ